jgi:hypothetical protein
LYAAALGLGSMYELRVFQTKQPIRSKEPSVNAAQLIVTLWIQTDLLSAIRLDRRQYFAVSTGDGRAGCYSCPLWGCSVKFIVNSLPFVSNNWVPEISNLRPSSSTASGN